MRRFSGWHACRAEARSRVSHVCVCQCQVNPGGVHNGPPANGRSLSRLLTGVRVVECARRLERSPSLLSTVLSNFVGDPEKGAPANFVSLPIRFQSSFDPILLVFDANRRFEKVSSSEELKPLVGSKKRRTDSSRSYRPAASFVRSNAKT